MLKLYDYLPSQNGFKIRLLLQHLRQPYQHVPVAIFQGESRTPEFLQKNPVGAIPVLEPEPGVYVAESNAILCYLAEGTAYLPSERLARARVMQWLFFEQYYVEPTLGTLRFWTIAGKLKANEAVAAVKRSSGERALDALERHLSQHPFLANDTYSIADIAVFAYSHLAAEAHFDLASRPSFVRWLERVKAQAGTLPQIYPYTPDAMA
ncbi:MAG TPA: glutathione S-transferase family protein [Steroidobacteraceae bacterium]|jgi:glutathione S-transferase|nr:glutathione S-transferase family protein [Steroidobacteraceae bacterium]